MDGSTRHAGANHRRDSAPGLRHAIPENDPAWQAFLRAPVDDEPLTDEDLEALAEGAASGPCVRHADVTAEIRRMAEADGAAAEFDALMGASAGAAYPAR